MLLSCVILLNVTDKPFMLSVFILSVIMQGVVMQSVIMLRVIMRRVPMLSVVRRLLALKFYIIGLAHLFFYFDKNSRF